MVLLTAVLFSACSQGKTNVTENTNGTVADETEEPTESYLYATEEETAVIPTVPDDVDYYEMYQEEMKDWDRSPSSGAFRSGYQYAKEWVSTDGRISFILDTRCGPFARTSPKATYTVDDEAYQTYAEFYGHGDSPYLVIQIETDNHCTIVLSGPFDYDHDEQSFTVRSDNDVLTAPAGYDMDKLKEEFNEEYGDPDIPYYHADEKVTFKMVR